MAKFSRSCPAPRAQQRPWEVVWEVEGQTFYREVLVSVHITAPELIASAAGIPEHCNSRYMVPAL